MHRPRHSPSGQMDPPLRAVRQLSGTRKREDTERPRDGSDSDKQCVEENHEGDAICLHCHRAMVRWVAHPQLYDGESSRLRRLTDFLGCASRNPSEPTAEASMVQPLATIIWRRNETIPSQRAAHGRTYLYLCACLLEASGRHTCRWLTGHPFLTTMTRCRRGISGPSILRAVSALRIRLIRALD